MLTELDLKEIENFKNYNNEIFKKQLAEDGFITPMMLVLLSKKNPEKETGMDYGIAVCHLPEEAFKDSNTKDMLAELVPDILSRIEKEGNKAVCTCLATEGYARELKVPKEINLSYEEIKDLAYSEYVVKKEIMVIIYECDLGESTYMYYIHRNGKIANEKGELLDAITLELHPECLKNNFIMIDEKNSASGRFNRLYYNYRKNNPFKDE